MSNNPYDNLPNMDTQIGGTVDLPFDYLKFWWKNGSPQLTTVKETDPVAYYGGWASHTEKYQQCSFMHPDATPYTWQNRQGASYDVFALRFLWAALITSRQGWFPVNRNDPNSPRRSAENFLVMLGLKNTKDNVMEFTRLGPAVLSGSSYSGQAIRNVFNQWNASSASLRASHANNAPAWFFYIPVGTMGKEILLEEKKSKHSNASSNITPCQTSEKVLKELTPELLDSLFVGQEVAEEMATMQELAQDWVDHWNRDDGQGQQRQTETPAQPDAPFSYGGEGYPDIDDDIPF